MRFYRSLAALPLAVLFAACSVNPDQTIDAATVAPITGGLVGDPMSPGADTPPAPAESAQAPGEPSAPGADPVAEPVAEPAAAPATSHVALKYLIGDVDPAKDPMFARIPEKYLGGSRVWGHRDAVAAFVRMAEDADVNGYQLKIVSAFRSFSDQKKIWEDKWTGKTLVGGKKLPVSHPEPKSRALKILQFSSMPATSRHHWGTDFDLNSLDNGYFTNTREGKRVYDWLTQHAAEYGFCQVYTKKGEDGRTGYEEEKWHWSYRPVADWYLKQYPIDVGYDRITGFQGSEAAPGIDVIKNYVNGISADCVQ